LVFGQVLNSPVAPPSSLREDIPAALDRVVLRGLDRDPARRFDSAHDMAVAIEEAVPVASPPVVGAFVTKIARNSLGRRAARVKEIESFTTPDAATTKILPLASSGRESFTSRPSMTDPDAARSLSKVTSVTMSRPGLSSSSPRRRSRALMFVSAL